MWLAYLETQGLLKPDDPAAVDALFAAFPVQPIPLQESEREQAQQAPAKGVDNPFACDDPTAG
jgi:hypothetical protein